jgi:carbamoyltransferase
MRNIVIGLNAFHADSSAALIVDGQLVVAAEEERFRRVKHWAGFPSQAIQFCLDEAGVQLRDVHAIALNTDPAAAKAKRFWYGIKHRPSIKLVMEKLRARRTRLSVQQHLQQAFPDQLFGGQVMPIEHHLAHLASAYYVSPFQRALAVSVDGFGDFASGAYGMGDGDQLAIDGHVYFPHSLGIFYQAMTQYLGFQNYGDEYKVMGLAPYGKASMVEPLQRLLQLKPDGAYALDLKFFRHHQASVTQDWLNGEPKFDRLYASALEDLLGPARDKNAPLTDRDRDLAASVQQVYELAFFHLLNRLHERYQVEQLVLAGGCAQNSVANGKITQRTPFHSVYVAASGADAGGAIGAGLVAARQLGQPRTAPFLHAYLGTQYSTQQCEAVIAGKSAELAAENVRVRKIDDEQALCDQTVEHLIQGHVIGWFQGRMEWGPRALGNRSILADPRRSDVKDILNLKIKRRESFRPFAPSILREYVSEWFELDADVPFMAQVFPIKPEKREAIPAVTHVDGSGRLQTVTVETNSRYFRLIDSFRQRTGVPILVNTSFNENEPVVCRPEEALACFLRTKMDVLVLGDWLLERQSV